MTYHKNPLTFPIKHFMRLKKLWKQCVFRLTLLFLFYYRLTTSVAGISMPWILQIRRRHVRKVLRYPERLFLLFLYPIYRASRNIDGTINERKCYNTVNIVSTPSEVASQNNEKIKSLISGFFRNNFYFLIYK